jgi:hypothetical protein
VRARGWVMVVAAVCGTSLAVGIPLLGLTALPRTEPADGVILWVHPAARTLLLQDDGAADPLRGQQVLIRLPERGGPRVQPGDRPVSALQPGQRIHTSISRQAHWAHAITLAT